MGFALYSATREGVTVAKALVAQMAASFHMDDQLAIRDILAISPCIYTRWHKEASSRPLWSWEDPEARSGSLQDVTRTCKLRLSKRGKKKQRLCSGRFDQLLANMSVRIDALPADVLPSEVDTLQADLLPRALAVHGKQWLVSNAHYNLSDLGPGTYGCQKSWKFVGRGRGQAAR